MLSGEKTSYWIHQLSNTAIIVCVCFLKIKHTPARLFATGPAAYLAGLLLLIVSAINFAAPAKGDMNQNGLSRLSRNPMYVVYFILFIGGALATQSPLLFALILVFQISAHRIILSEER